MKLKSCFTLALLGSATLSAFSGIAHAIVGGAPVAQSNPIASSTVAVLNSSGFGPCSGSLLTPEVAITAAHCVWDQARGGAMDPRAIRVHFGPNAWSPIRVSRVTSVAILPSYRGPRSQHGADVSDIALVRFTGGLPKGFRPASILTDQSALRENASVVLAGYGVTNPSQGSGAGTLRTTTVPLLNPRFGHTEVLLDQTSGRGACGGDSGGPAFVKRGNRLELFGVTSRGYPDFTDDGCIQQSVYTNLMAHVGWIGQTIGRMKAQGR